jgi:hypothetical protein
VKSSPRVPLCRVWDFELGKEFEVELLDGVKLAAS